MREDSLSEAPNNYSLRVTALDESDKPIDYFEALVLIPCCWWRPSRGAQGKSRPGMFFTSQGVYDGPTTKNPHSLHAIITSKYVQ